MKTIELSDQTVYFFDSVKGLLAELNTYDNKRCSARNVISEIRDVRKELNKLSRMITKNLESEKCSNCRSSKTVNNNVKFDLLCKKSKIMQFKDGWCVNWRIKIK